MPEIFQFDDYRAFIKAYVAMLPKGGRGFYRKLSSDLKTNTVTISQIMAGKRSFNMDQGYHLTEIFGLGETEARYFQCLVQIDLAGSERLKKHLRSNLKVLKKEARDLKKVLHQSTEVSENAKAVFYSDWVYSALRILCAIDSDLSAQQFADKLDLSTERVSEAIRFLLENGLLERTKDGLRVRMKSTHLEASSPLIKSRQLSWRIKAAEYMESDTEQFFYTGPCSISHEDYEEFRNELVQLIKSFSERVSRTKAQRLACLNIDFFRLT